MSVPDNQADIYNVPSDVITSIKRILNSEEFTSGKDYSVFTYDDGSMVIYRYVKDPVRPSHIKVYSKKDVNVLLDVVNGDMIEARDEIFREGWKEIRYHMADVTVAPGDFKWLQWK